MIAEDQQAGQWEAAYRRDSPEKLPWYYPELDPDLRWAIGALGLHVPAVLDIGTGSGTQAIALANLGFRVLGTDTSIAAVCDAAHRAFRLRAPASFLKDDIVNTGLAGQFDFIVDRGCLHTLDADSRRRYVAAIAGLLRPGGFLLLKMLLQWPAGDAPPTPFSQADVRELFSGHLDLCAARQTVFHGNVHPPPPALFCILRRS